MNILIPFLQVELALTYGCELTQEQMVQYIHFNRLHNMMLMKYNDDVFMCLFQIRYSFFKSVRNY